MINRRELFKKTLVGTALLGVMRNVFSQPKTAISSVSQIDPDLSSDLKKRFTNGISWSEYFNYLYGRAVIFNDQPNVGILNTLDEAGYPIGLPMHFEFKNDFFYFAMNSAAKRNDTILKNKNISLLIYYNSLNQSTVLIKGKAKSTPIKYQYKADDSQQTQILYEVEPTEVNLSFLDDSTRNKQEIKRNLYTFKKIGSSWERSSRVISIQNDLDDLMAQLSLKNHKWLAPLLP